AAERGNKANEPQVRERRLAVGLERKAARAEHAEVADEGFEPGAEACRGDDLVRRETRSVGENDVGPVEALDGGHHLDAAAAYGVDDADVEDRRRACGDERR